MPVTAPALELTAGALAVVAAHASTQPPWTLAARPWPRQYQLDVSVGRTDMMRFARTAKTAGKSQQVERKAPLQPHAADQTHSESSGLRAPRNHTTAASESLRPFSCTGRDLRSAGGTMASRTPRGITRRTRACKRSEKASGAARNAAKAARRASRTDYALVAQGMLFDSSRA